ncbi:hypothetical protein [Mesobacillus subterraneus]|uniref:Uncharacterized protein n=1 Tax=Mesobacillus subterraneus TaxID=285983 RepID=A0A3R9FFH3_9BACI|nr:hypothetical protein [Mesobacillus subterraneus]RSD26840.1 hypothetical protein EJA10_13390 [Mesobacillus subterraneus]
MSEPIENKLADYLDSIQKFILITADQEIQQELTVVSDALECGAISLDTALYWDHIEARKLLRKAFSDADFLNVKMRV